MDGAATIPFEEAEGRQNLRAGQGAADTPNLDLDGFSGPLDLLLRLARSHDVNLAALPVTAIIDQLAIAMSAAPAAMPLSQKADWLVMASWILLLRSSLLLPADVPAQQDAQLEAGQLRDRLLALQEAQGLAAWLDRRPMLGRDVFARGRDEYPGGFTEIRHAQVDVIAFLWAAMALFDDDIADDVETTTRYRPAMPELFSIPEARRRIMQLLAEAPGGQTLFELLPAEVYGAEGRQLSKLRRTSAWTSTFVASLELAKQGDVIIQQHHIFANIMVKKFNQH